MASGLPGWENLGGHPWKIYEHTPLVLALCQVRFPTRLSVNNPGGAVAAFQDAIASEYPETPPSTQNVAQIHILGGETQVPVSPLAPPVVWQFADRKGDWVVVLTQDFVTLETRSYNDFADFLDRLGRVLAALVETVRPPFCRRIGLRYINEIRADHMEWQRIIRSELLGPVATEPFMSHVVQAAQQLVLRAGEAQINLQHGVFPSGTTVQPRPSERVEPAPFYLLDIDVFREASADDELPMDPTQTCTHVQTFHDTISEIFRWATTEAYVSTLGERCHVPR